MKFSRFQNDPRILRVDGFSNLQLHDTVRPKIIVHFSVIHPEWAHRPFAKQAPTGKVEPYSTYAGNILHFTCGSLWQRGESKPYLPPAALDVTIDPLTAIKTTLEDLSVKEFTAQKGSALTLNRNELLNTRVIRVASSDERFSYVAIPCHEILRFFFGSSSNMLFDIITGNVTDNIDWNKSDHIGPRVVMVSKRALYSLDAFVYAHAISSPVFKEALFKPSRKIRRLKAHGMVEPIHFETYLPFDKTVSCRLIGHPLTAHDVPKPILYVSKFLKSDLMPPFRHLDETHEYLERKPRGTSEYQGSKRPKSENVDDPKEETRVDTPPSAKQPRSNKPMFDQHFNRYQNITRRLQRVQVGESEGLRKKRKGSTDEINTSSAAGSYSEASDNVGGVNDQIISQDHSNSLLLPFIQLTKHIREKLKTSWEINTLSPGLSTIDLQGETICLLDHDMTGCITWNYVSSSHDARLRHAIFVKAKRKDIEQPVYLIEIEKRILGNGDLSGLSTIAILPKHNDLTESDLKKIIDITGQQKNWPTSAQTWRNAIIAAMAAELIENYDAYCIPHPHFKTSELTEKQLDIWMDNIFDAIPIEKASAKETEKSTED